MVTKMYGGCTAWVSISCVGDDRHADFAGLALALSLIRKHRIAQEYLPPVMDALTELEDAIVKNYGEAKLTQLKAKEADFMEKVVNHEQHGQLDNPYDLPVPSGKLHLCGDAPILIAP